jgi:hypothetical protein
MKRLVLMLIALVSTAMPAGADVFDVDIPGAGRPEKVEAGFSPGVDGRGEPQGPFPGKVSFPFLAYCRVYRANYESAVTVSQEVRIISPSGRIVDAAIGASHITWGAGEWYRTTYRQINKLDDFGTYTFQFFFNGVEVARLNLHVRQVD